MIHSGYPPAMAAICASLPLRRAPAFDRLAKPTSGRLKAQARSPARSGPMSRPTPARSAAGAPLHQRQELAPGKAGRYGRGNCPGCGSAPIEACRKADGAHEYPLTAVRLGRFFGSFSIAVVEAGERNPAKLSWRASKQSSRTVFPFHLRDASPQCCHQICIVRAVQVSPFPCISLDSLVRIETYQWVARDISRKNFFIAFLPPEFETLEGRPLARLCGSAEVFIEQA